MQNRGDAVCERELRHTPSRLALVLLVERPDVHGDLGWRVLGIPEKLVLLLIGATKKCETAEHHPNTILIHGEGRGAKACAGVPWCRPA